MRLELLRLAAQDADDLQSEVMFNAALGVRASKEPVGNIPGYFRKAGRNGLFDAFRRRLRKSDPLAGADSLTDMDFVNGAATKIDPAFTPPAAAARAEAIDRVRKAVRLLDPRRRDVVTMKFFQGMADEEIAAALDISPARVGQLRRGALARLRPNLEKISETAI